MDLTDGQLAALRNLGHKHDGDHVGFINISDARQLTELAPGRTAREGWDITPSGLSAPALKA